MQRMGIEEIDSYRNQFTLLLLLLLRKNINYTKSRKVTSASLTIPPNNTESLKEFLFGGEEGRESS